MTENTDSITAELQSLRLPELQARYREVFGEDTRCPNRTYLIRKIGERLDSAPCASEPEALLPATEEIDQAVAISDEDVTELDEAGSQQPVRDETVTERDETEEMSTEGDELPTESENVPPEPPLERDDEPTKPEPAIEEEAPREHEVAAAECEQSPEAARVEAGCDSAPPSDENDGPQDRMQKPGRRRGRFASMTVEELQAMYLATVGRPSSSRHPAYLQWKIRAAERGRVPVGSRKAHARQGDPVEVRVLPLRLEAETVTAIDEAWRERGMKTRMEFLRRALGHYLEHLGASEVAARLENGSAA